MPSPETFQPAYVVASGAPGWAIDLPPNLKPGLQGRTMAPLKCPEGQRVTPLADMTATTRLPPHHLAHRMLRTRMIVRPMAPIGYVSDHH